MHIALSIRMSLGLYMPSLFGIRMCMLVSTFLNPPSLQFNHPLDFLTTVLCFSSLDLLDPSPAGWRPCRRRIQKVCHGANLHHPIPHFPHFPPFSSISCLNHPFPFPPSFLFPLKPVYYSRKHFFYFDIAVGEF